MNKKIAVSFIIFLSVFFIVTYTAKDYGIAWDEPQYFYSSDLIMEWFSMFGNSLTKADLSNVISDKTITKYWHWAPEHVPHPPFSRILSGLTRTIFSPLVDNITAYRMSTAFLFALLTTIVYLWMAALYDIKTGIFSALSVFLMPHLFGHAHFAMTDIPLTTMWFLTVYCFYRGLTDYRWSIVLGIVFGLSLSTKFPAFLTPIPLFIWAHIYKRRQYHNNAFSMIFLSPIIMIATQPYLWHRTLPRIIEFIYDSTTRLYTPGKSFLNFFMHKQYFSDQLPWFYSYFMIGVTLPLATLFFSVLGIYLMFKDRGKDAIPMLFIINALFIITIPLMPGAVMHDGIRLLIPSIPFLAAFAGVGFYHTYRYIYSKLSEIKRFEGIKNLKTKFTTAVFLLAFIPPSLDIIALHPYELSYYNELVGGIKGAYRMGLEVTYLQEAINPKFLRVLNNELPYGAKLNASFSTFMMEIYQKNGMLRQDIKLTYDRDCDFYMLLNRQSAFIDFEKWLVSDNQPAMALKIRDVPLIFLYRFK